MALLQRTRILPQQRLDLPDFRNIEDFVCADFKAQFKNIWTGENFVLKGFVTTGIGTNAISMALAGSALIVGSDDGTMFIGAPSLSPATSDALTPASTNYVELSIEQDTGGADSRAFWDPTAAAGQGGEFSQIVDTFIFTKAKLNINTSNFTGAADRVPICEVDVNGSGIITDIRDARNMFWRLGRRGQDTFQYSWASRTEPPVSQFNGADKDIDSEKAWKDAVMSRILELDGGLHWFEDSGVSNVGAFRNVGLSMTTSQSTDAKWSWDGSLLKLTDSNVTPLDADAIAAIRLFDSTSNLMLTRQDGTGGSTSFALADGDVLWVELPDPLANVNYSGIGLTASNFRVSPRGSVPNNDSTFWLAFREGANCFLRYFGELEPGEVVEISDNINENILAAIGIALETDMPNYTSNNYVVDNTSLVAATSALDAELGLVNIRASQDRSSKLIEGGTWSLDYLGTTLSWSADAFIDVPEVTRVSNRILSGNVTLPNPNSVAYVSINRASGPASLTVTVADVDAVPYSDDIVIIARRVTAGVLVGQHSFLVKAGEYLELDGALAEINRLLGQLRITKHETAANKARISAADVTLLSGNTLSQIIGDFLLKFDGAVINFTTGAVLQADDSTPLGVNFTPFSVPVGEYFWYALSLLPDTINADNTQNATVQVDLADSSNASAAAALKAVISGDIKLGEVQVFNNAGSIEVFDVHRLGVGSGSGSGSGDASSLDTALRDRFTVNNMLYLTENIFRIDKATKVDLASTGAYAPAKKAFGFTAAAQTLISADHLDQDFLDSGADITEIEFYLFWLQNFIDDSATYEVSRDGGNNWQVADMSRVGNTNAWRAYHRFTDEVSPVVFESVGATGAGSALNATTNQQLSSKLVVASTSVVRSLDLEMNYGGSGTGTVTARIVRDNAGSPSTDILDILSESDAKTISAASLGGTGDLSVNFDMPDVVLTAGTYHIVALTDAAYKAGTLDLSWRSGAGTDGATFNGASWTPGASSKAHSTNGRPHDLRVRVTSSTGDVYIEGYGVYYGLTERGQAIGQRKIQKFSFSGDENRTDFLVDFELDPEIVEVYDPLRGQVYVVQDGVLRNEGNTLKFEPDTFDFPGETIVLIVRQLEGNGTDTSNANAAAISEIQFNLLDLGEEIAALSNSMILPKINAPNTTILNRAQMPDLTQDLKPRFAVDRIMAQQVYKLSNEQGPNGELVYGLVNDQANQVRFVGNVVNSNSTNGPNLVLSDINDFIEISFYGTGLNLLSVSNTVWDARATVDGGSEGANFMTSSSTVLAVRNYSPNIVFPVVSGLTLGMHTVKIRNNSASGLNVNGFEILNSNSSGLIQLPPGSQYHKGKKRTHSVLETTPYNSGFETGTLGTRGGRVLIYQKSDGSVAKAVTPTDASQLTLTSTDHSNEEIARIYNVREFGCGRSDDFSVITTPGVKAFTLEDGTTTLAASGAASQILSGIDGVAYQVVNNIHTITFVGTGLDIQTVNTSFTGTVTASIDGAAESAVTIPASKFGTQKIVSGLPYGTHTVKFTLTVVGTGQFNFVNYIVYQPKTPTLPVGAIAIGAYNVMANFVANATQAAENIATGVLRKAAARELLYTGASWTSGTTVGTGTTGAVAGFRTLGAAAAQTVKYTFFGTGFDLRISTPVAVNTFTVAIDGTNPTAAGASATGFYGQFSSFVAGTGVATSNGTGNFANGLWVSGLPLGLHTITLTQNAATSFGFESIDIVCPIHSLKLNGPIALQNTLNVGSQGILDLRKFTKADQPVSSKRVYSQGISASPTNASTTLLPIPEMSSSIYIEEDGDYLVNLSISHLLSSPSNSTSFAILVDGIQVTDDLLQQEQSSTYTNLSTFSVPVFLSKGYHTIIGAWKVTAGTATASTTRRSLSVSKVG